MKELKSEKTYNNYLLQNMELLITKNYYHLLKIGEQPTTFGTKKVFYFMHYESKNKIELSYYELKYFNLAEQEKFLNEYNLIK